MTPPVVFVSYSHESPEHREAVLELCQWLRQEGGLEVVLDQFIEHDPPASWPVWMETQLEGADVVLMVCSAGYKEKVGGRTDPGTGRGARWEGSIIRRELYNARRGEGTRFVPVLLVDSTEADIPGFIAETTHYRVAALDHQTMEPLLRRIWGKPAVTAAPVGPAPELPGKGSRGAEMLDKLTTVSGDLDVFDAFGVVSVFNGRSVRIKEEYDRRLSAATECLDVIGFGLRAFREDYGDRFAEFSSRLAVRILLVDPVPEQPRPSFADLRDVEEGNPVGSIATDVQMFLREYDRLETKGEGSFEVRLYGSIPAMNTFRVDGEMFWGPYLFGQQSRNAPTILLRRGGILYERFRQHFEDVWETARPPTAGDLQ